MNILHTLPLLAVVASILFLIVTAVSKVRAYHAETMARETTGAMMLLTEARAFQATAMAKR